ncbi:MAG: UDP-N-acetylglucosamine 1-carboxyvinyltransferase [Firmicutes bacterium]|nr:UDP-N-acetylglucosamine 1-carboxyvinyltransferase [Bacillota bacterium]
MEYLQIEGKQRINGKVKVNGAKNAAVAILPAALLTEESVRIGNLPRITDIDKLVKILEALGAKVSFTEERYLHIDSSDIYDLPPPPSLVNKFRASYYLMGVLLGRFGRVEIPMPGGCDLGPRPIDQHIKGFTALGAEVELDHGLVKITANKLRGAHIYLDVVSVGATINIMLAAVKAEGKTIIENVAKEPEIVDVANFLNAMGGHVVGAGTDVIKIQGVSELGSAEHTVIPDRIEAGTFMIAAAATGGEALITDVIPKHLDPVIAKLKEVGIILETGTDWIKVKGNNKLSSTDVKTFPYPGFPTDLQAPMMVLLTQVPGTSYLTENVFEGRFRHVGELKKMGARIKLGGRTAIIEGGHELVSAPIRATDLRGGAAFIIAGLVSCGDTILTGVEHIDRGYEDIEIRLRQLGVNLKRKTANGEIFPGK